MEEIVLSHVAKSFGKQIVLSDVSCTIAPGKITCILGGSGEGKSTLLKILAGLIPYEGTITGLPERSSFVFQSARLIPNLTVAENLRFALPKEVWGEIDGILLRLGIEGKKNAYPHTLSGGEAQRVSFARAFLYPSELLLMDEPFSSLDLSRKIGLIEAFASLWQREKRTVIFVTHDPEEVSMLSERAICLRGGRITADVRREGTVPAPYGSDSDYRRRVLACILDQ